MKYKFYQEELWPVLIADEDGATEIELTEEEYDKYNKAFRAFEKEWYHLLNRIEKD